MARSVTIAGGGLGGLSLGLGLRRRGIAVEIVEAGHYPRHRVCGEFISGVRLETLRQLGMEDVFDDALRHAGVCWKLGDRVVMRARIPCPAIAISRHRLDERLASLFLREGGTLRTGVRLQPDAREGLVWAAGRRPVAGEWIGLKAHARGLPREADLEMHGGLGGYVGLTEVEEGWTNVCGLFRLDRGLREKGPRLLASYAARSGMTSLAHAMRGAEWRDDSFCAVAGFALGRQRGSAGPLVIGDAESLIPPFTGNGMSMAFEAAEAAVDPLVDWAEGRLAWQGAVARVRARLRKRFALRLAVAAAVHPWILSERGQCCIRSLASASLLPFRTLWTLSR